MRLLYLSCHSSLEHSELLLFSEMGIEVFSAGGAYVEPRNPGDPSMRPALDIVPDPKTWEMWHALCHKFGPTVKNNLSKEFIDQFDAVMVMHLPEWIMSNWERMKHKPVIWRTIGQAISTQEMMLAYCRSQGMKIVRYSPRERFIPNFLGADDEIRFYKDPEEFKGWTGEVEEVVTLNQAIKQRATACNWDIYKQIVDVIPQARLYGKSNEDTRDDLKEKLVGEVSYERLKEVLRQSRCYFYVGTWPASYTLNFVEALITGIPVIALGPKYGHPTRDFPGHELYEVHELLEPLKNGYWSDNILTLVSFIRWLLKDHKAAKEIGDEGRKKAIELFGKSSIRTKWDGFFRRLDCDYKTSAV